MRKRNETKRRENAATEFPGHLQTVGGLITNALLPQGTTFPEWIGHLAKASSHPEIELIAGTSRAMIDRAEGLVRVDSSRRPNLFPELGIQFHALRGERVFSCSSCVDLRDNSVSVNVELCHHRNFQKAEELMEFGAPERLLNATDLEVMIENTSLFTLAFLDRWVIFPGTVFRTNRGLLQFAVVCWSGRVARVNLIPISNANGFSMALREEIN